MPRFDGTGPRGMGPGTGRGLGPCGAGMGWGRGYGMGYGAGWCGCPYCGATPTKDDEKAMLEEQLKAVNERLSQLENDK